MTPADVVASILVGLGGVLLILDVVHSRRREWASSTLLVAGALALILAGIVVLVLFP
jgi:hypothetical protein